MPMTMFCKTSFRKTLRITIFMLQVAVQLQTIFSCKVQMEAVGNLGYKTNYATLKYENYGFVGCAKECKRISPCSSFNYDRLNFVCEMVFTNDQSDTVVDDRYVYSKIKDWPEDCFDTLQTTCEPCLKAVTLSSGSTICVDIGLKFSTGEEIAALKPSHQSSLYSYSHNASNAVNGNKTDYILTHCQPISWWFTNLQGEILIDKVRVYMPEEGHPNVTSTHISILIGPSLSRMSICGSFIGSASHGTIYDITCSSHVLSQFVFLSEISMIYSCKMLQFAEIEVFSKENYCVRTP